MQVKTMDDVAFILSNSSSEDLRMLVALLSNDLHITGARLSTMHAMATAYNVAAHKQPKNLRD